MTPTGVLRETTPSCRPLPHVRILIHCGNGLLNVHCLLRESIAHSERYHFYAVLSRVLNKFCNNHCRFKNWSWRRFLAGKLKTSEHFCKAPRLLVPPLKTRTRYLKRLWWALDSLWPFFMRLAPRKELAGVCVERVKAWLSRGLPKGPRSGRGW